VVGAELGRVAMVGLLEGDCVRLGVGLCEVGKVVGAVVGEFGGLFVVGEADGPFVGRTVGWFVGDFVEGLQKHSFPLTEIGSPK